MSSAASARCSDRASSSLFSPSRISLPRSRCRVGQHIELFEACSAFTRVTARTLAPSPIRDLLDRRLQPFRHLHDCSGCFRLERLAGWDLHHKLLAGLPAHSLALRPAHSRRHLYVNCYTEGFSHFVTSMTAPVASGWSGYRVGLAPTGSAAFSRRTRQAGVAARVRFSSGGGSDHRTQAFFRNANRHRHLGAVL